MSCNGDAAREREIAGYFDALWPPLGEGGAEQHAFLAAFGFGGAV